MKYINWGIISDDNIKMDVISSALNKIPGSTVVSKIDSQNSDIIDIAERTDIDAIFISVPANLISTYAIVSMNSGKDVLLDLPFASNYEEGIRINRMQETTRQSCFITSYRRYLPYFQKIKQLLHEEIIGNIMNVNLRFWCSNDDVHDIDKPEKGIVLGNEVKAIVFSHIDYIQYLLGIIVEVKKLGDSEDTFVTEKKQNMVNACFMMDNGVQVNSSWNFDVPHFIKQDVIEIIGDDGMLSFSLSGDLPILLTKEDQQSIPVDYSTNIDVYPLLKSVVETLQGFSVCTSTSVNVTPSLWVMDQLFNI